MRSLCWAALFGAIFSCAPEGAVLDVTVIGAEGADSIWVTVKRPDRATASAQEQGLRGGGFAVTVPDLEQGEVLVIVSARDGRPCQIARGEARQKIDGPGRYPVQIELTPKEGCHLSLLQEPGPNAGAGQVMRDRDGPACAERASCWSFPQGTSIRLRAEEGAGSYFAGWSTDTPKQCPGTGSCLVTVPPEGIEVRYAFYRRQRCYDAGFCWQNPLPDGSTLRGVSGSSAEDVWTAGSGGTVLHWNGRFWGPVESGVQTDLLSVWVAGRDDIWAVGSSGVILHGDGVRFVRQEPPPQPRWAPWSDKVDLKWNRVWGRGPKDVWFVGDLGALLHWDGARFALVDSGTDAALLSVWAGEDEVWIGGAAGSIRRRKGGGSFTAVASETSQDVRALWGQSPREIWAAGGTDTSTATPSLGMVQRWDGARWRRWSLDRIVLGGISTGQDVWLHGRDGRIWRLQENSFERVQTGQDVPLLGMWAAGDAAIWAVGGGGTALRWDGRFWALANATERRFLSAVWGRSEKDAWAAGINGALLHWDGSAWLSFFNEPFSIFGIWGVPGQDILLLAAGSLISIQNDRSSLADVGFAVVGIAGTSAQDIWMVGKQSVRQGNDLIEQGVVAHAELKAGVLGGTYPYTEIGKGIYFLSVWPDPRGGEAWVAGYDAQGPILLHGSAMGGWAKVPLAQPGVLRSVWGDGRGTVWAVGARDQGGGRAGTAWRVRNGVPESVSCGLGGVALTAVHGAAGEVFAAGEGDLLRWREDRSCWEPQGVRTGNILTALWSARTGDLWAVGSAGAILHRPPGGGKP